MTDDSFIQENQIQQRCWIDGCTHTYECDDLEHLSRAVFLHLEGEHDGPVQELLA